MRTRVFLPAVMIAGCSAPLMTPSMTQAPPPIVVATPPAPLSHDGGGAFVVMLGSDTTAVEQYTRAGNTVTGDLVTRQGGTVINHYALTLNPDGTPSRLNVTATKPGGAPAPGIRSITATYGADTAVVVTMRDTAVTRRFAVKQPFPMFQGLTPSIAMLEVVFARLRDIRADTVGVAAIGVTAGATPRALTYVKFYEGDSARIWSPGYGVQFARVDATGQVLGFSGRQTTQKVEVRRVPSIDLQKVAAGFAAADSRASATIVSSRKDSVNTMVGGAKISVVYFRPTARGRDIFRNGVLGDTIWRTGANDATMFTTSKDIVAEGKTIPAGTYTLFTHVPRDNSRYELIFNKQTKQWGTAYDPAQDLVRIPLRLGTIVQPMEAFSIEVMPYGSPNTGMIVMQWAHTQLALPFTVAP
jgi:hypothetical protein